MTRRLLWFLSGLVLFSIVLAPATFADLSHARIVRLSLVQGDVRFVSSYHEDSLTDPNATWETASLNLPIRQGFALATDNGRAEVEFENGAMVFLAPNTVVEFYDLSLRDGDHITRLVLRQGSLVTYVNPAHGDYFSVTGGDFTVEAIARTTFRLDNFDDGSNVNVEQGRVNVLRNEKSTPLEKGQSLAIRASDSANPTIGRSADLDDFDHWVSGRIENVTTATNYSSQYVSSPDYTSGFGDLYTYGSWLSVGGYGNCWRPFGVGLGWSPFSYGNWYYDNGFGWSFIGSAPWGWLPYHYGGWIFSPVYGWVWVPSGFGYGVPIHYRPVTAVWVHSGTTTGIVPLHPGDKYGKSSQNLSQGVYPVQNSQLVHSTLVPGNGKWSVLKEVPRESLSASVTTTTPPTRVSRTILTSNSGSRTVTLSRDSSIAYDPREHRFVNTNTNPPESTLKRNSEDIKEVSNHLGVTSTTSGNTNGVKTPGTPIIPANPQSQSSTHAGNLPRAPLTPPPPHTTGSGWNSGGSSSGGGASWGGSGRGSSSGGSHPSGGSSSHPSGGGGGGGSHPH